MNDDDVKIPRAVRTARENICEGVIMEPRMFFDEIQIDVDGAVSFSAPDVFKNGEEFPVQITDIVAAVRLLDDEGETTDERLIQRVAMRLTYHGSEYMRREFVPLPLWHNVPVAAGQAMQFGQSSWYFDKPFVLSSRDTMAVRVALDAIPASPRVVTASFTGYGLDTKRPYFKSGDVEITDVVSHIVPPERFRNDGDEPIVVTEMALHCSAEEQSASPQGDIRQCRVQINQVGNGTQAEWVDGPDTIPNRMAPGTVWGPTSGRAIVHRLPGDGFYWEPGEGLQIEMQPVVTGLNGDVDFSIVVAFLGTITVT